MFVGAAFFVDSRPMDASQAVPYPTEDVGADDTGHGSGGDSGGPYTGGDNDDACEGTEGSGVDGGLGRTVRKAWTADEDAALAHVVGVCATESLEGLPADGAEGALAPGISWVRVAQMVPGRSSKQCRERWLSLGRQSRPWGEEETRVLLQQQQLLGYK